LGVGTPRAIVFVVDGVEVAAWPVVLDGPPDLVVVDALARLHLDARRLGGAIRLRNPCEQLCRLLELVGMAELLPLEALGQPEEREQFGVQEVVQRRDPTA
jgi:hypothetical protein